MFEIEGASVKRVRDSGPSLPFTRKELNDDEAVVVHFKIATSDLETRRELAQQINLALKDVRVRGHSIIPAFSNESVEMSAIDARLLAAHIVPYVKQALGIP